MPGEELLPSLGEPARRRLSALGCRLMLGSPVKRILGGGSGSNGGGAITGVKLGSGEVAAGGCYVSALPWYALPPLLPGYVADADPFFRRIGCIQASPIVNIHLWYDRAVMAEDFCAFVDSPLQWVFNKGSIASVDAPLSRENSSSGDAHRICVSLSAAWDYIDLPREELAAMAHAEVIRAFPALGDGPGSVAVAGSVAGAPVESPRLLRWVVVKQRNATIRCLPGVGALRPGSVTPIPNLFLAGGLDGHRVAFHSGGSGPQRLQRGAGSCCLGGRGCRGWMSWQARLLGNYLGALEPAAGGDGGQTD